MGKQVVTGEPISLEESIAWNPDHHSNGGRGESLPDSRTLRNGQPAVHFELNEPTSAPFFLGWAVRPVNQLLGAKSRRLYWKNPDGSH